MRPDIVPSLGDQCLAHAVSVMRLALRYRKGLPKEWDYQPGDSIGHIIENVHWAFPGRQVMVIAPHPINWCFTEDFWEDYLLAFIYVDAQGEIAHAVIGAPWEPKGMEITWVIAVSIEKQ
jgi:hypothetical protein